MDKLLQADCLLLLLLYIQKFDVIDTKPVCDAEDLPTKMTALQKCINVITRCPRPGEGVTVWANICISHDYEFEEILNLTSFDLQSNEINLMSKRIQAHKSNTPGYFQFICNQAEPLDVYQQIITDIGTTWN